MEKAHKKPAKITTWWKKRIKNLQKLRLSKKQAHQLAGITVKTCKNYDLVKNKRINPQKLRVKVYKRHTNPQKVRVKKHQRHTNPQKVRVKTETTPSILKTTPSDL